MHLDCKFCSNFAEETLTGNSKIHFFTNKGWTHSPGKSSQGKAATGPKALAQLRTYRTQAKSRIKPRPHLLQIARAFMRAWLGLVVKNARNLA